jgi:hypothetical protein
MSEEDIRSATMGNELISVDSVLTLLTTASWHLDRAASRSAEEARLDLQAARVSYDEVIRILPRIHGEPAQIERMQGRLTELENRLAALDGRGLDD